MNKPLFVRVHPIGSDDEKEVYVNFLHVAKVKTRTGGGSMIVMSDGSGVEISANPSDVITLVVNIP